MIAAAALLGALLKCEYKFSCTLHSARPFSAVGAKNDSASIEYPAGFDIVKSYHLVSRRFTSAESTIHVQANVNSFMADEEEKVALQLKHTRSAVKATNLLRFQPQEESSANY